MVTIDEQTETKAVADNAKHQELERVLVGGTKEDYMTSLNHIRFNYVPDSKRPDIVRYTVDIPQTPGSYRTALCNKLFTTKLFTEIGGNGLVRYGRRLHASGQYDLLIKNVRDQLDRNFGSFMIRTKQSPNNGDNPVFVARALLSPRFKRMDDNVLFPLIDSILEDFPSMNPLGKGMNTGERTFARFVSKDPIIEKGKRKIYIGFQITNSEVGSSGLSIEFFLCDGYCDNGMVFGKESLELGEFYMKHLGKKCQITSGLIPQGAIPYSDRDKIRQHIRSMLSVEKLYSIRELVESSFERTFTAEPELVIERFGQYYDCTKEEIDQAKEEFDYNERHAYGLQAAFTAVGQSSDSFDRRAELDRIGGRIVEQDNAQWERLVLVS